MDKKKIMLHIIMPDQVSGPNNAAKRIAASELSEKYEFSFLEQTFHAGGRINIKLIKDLKKQIKDFNPDIIHLSGMQSSGFHAVIAARIAGKKNILITVRGFSGDAININNVKSWAFTSIFEPLTLKMTKFFYTVCQEAAKKPMIVKNKKKNLGVIHNAAPNIEIDISHERYVFRNKIGASSDDFLVVISGRMTYDKGMSFIMEAIKSVSDKKIKFVFIGDGEYYDIFQVKLKTEIKNNQVFLLGKCDNVINILAGCDLFLFATLHENLSNALLEAMAVGLPVVATAVGGNIEVVHDNVNGYLIEPANSREIIDKVCAIKANEKLRKDFAAQSVNIIRESFTQKKLYIQIEKIYEKMFSEKN